MSHTGENVVRIEAEALRGLANRLAGPMAADFARAVELMASCSGRVVVTGMGKSGLVARKIAATLSSTGTPALFLHPAEAVHGDLGMLVRGDLVIALSASGETEEILRLLANIKRLELPLISLTCDPIHSGAPRASTQALHSGESPAPTSRASTHSKSGHERTARERRSALRLSHIERLATAAVAKPAKDAAARPSTLAQAADVALDCSVAQEACSLGLAPTASTAAMMALGDALAVALAEKRGFKEEDFANLHPGGKLGKRLAHVGSLMHSGAAVPRVGPETRMTDVIYEMSRKGLGITTVVEGEKLLGVISDGDLRRLLERSAKSGKNVLELTARECMTAHPQTVSAGEFAATALDIMEQKKITSLVVVDGHGQLEGIVHLHDLWETEMF